MTKKACCCNTTTVCCNPTFYSDFITLYGTSMAETAEVSPDDWIALYTPRPGTPRQSSRRFFNNDSDPGCNCCCGCPPDTQGPEKNPDEVPNNFKLVNIKNNTGFSLRNTLKNNFFGSKSDNVYRSGLSNKLASTDKTSSIEKTFTNQIPNQRSANGGVDPDAPPCGSDQGAWNSGNRDLSTDPHTYCARACCTGDFYESWMNDAEPIVFAYKYSGCYLTWHPREYSFDFDVYVNQCNGFLGYRRALDENGNQQGYETAQNSCQQWAFQKSYAGAAFNNDMDACYYGFYPTRQTNPIFPCACVPFPHIHGGVRDSVFNRVNVRLTENQIGYVSHMPAFSAPMLTSQEAGCCWCASAAQSAGEFDKYSKGRASCFRATYPYYDQQGKSISATDACAPGINCHFQPGQVDSSIARNPGYKKRCYEWGISPYLLRISKDDYKMAYSIWRHGRNSAYKHDFGPTYRGLGVQIDQARKDINVRFKKISGTKTSLKEQYIGFIQLEHHFECYAFQSLDGSKSVSLPPLQNHCTMQNIPFERGYAGRFVQSGSNKVLWTPWNYDSILWQVKRGIPRRVMYKGSGIPLFHFDLVSMENLSISNNIQGPGGLFDGVLFLEHYNRYFFGMRYFSSGKCTEPGGKPGPVEWNFNHLLNSYDYVNFWLQRMIENGITRIKDHAIDISSDVNKVIQTGIYQTNNEGQQEILIPDTIGLLTGGLSGYIDLINFFGVCAGTQNATTPKIIKNKLLNTEGLFGFTGPSGDKEQMICFLPRKATLPLASILTGITGWGCTADSQPGNTYDYIECAPYTDDAINIPLIFNVTDLDSVWSNIRPIRVTSGLGGTFVTDVSGKLIVMGGIPSGGDGPCDDAITTQYPSSITCTPFYLGIFSILEYNEDEQLRLRPQEKITDGTIIDLVFKGDDFASVLINFENGGLSALCYSAEVGNDGNSAFDTDEDGSDAYYATNCNGANSKNFPGVGTLCVPNDPFYAVPGLLGDVVLGIRSVAGESRHPDAYRIKSWGSNARLATFSLSQQDSNGGLLGGYDPAVNPNNLRYPGTNTWFIWTKIAAGLKHFVALDDFGGVFASPLSDNTDHQCDKGFPLTYEESALYKYKGFGRSGFKATGSDDTGFFYYNHIPRPGYVKEEEWTKEFYISLTSPNSEFNEYQRYLCACLYGTPAESCRNNSEGPGGGGPGFVPNEERCSSKTITTGATCSAPDPAIYDITCNLLGTLIYNSDVPIGTIGDYQPRYTNVAAGHYNTLLVTNENLLEIYGRYYQIDDQGTPNGPLVTVDTGSGEETNVLQGITCFIPEALKALKGTWDVTYGCGFTCDGVTHSPILRAEYFPPGENSLITDIDSSCDYSMCVVGNNRVYVWGDASMVPGSYNPSTYVPGTVSSTEIRLSDFDISLIDIDKISAGVNAFYISYRIKIAGTDFTSSRVYSYTRYGKQDFGTGVPIELQNKEIVDISAGYAHAIAIYSTGKEAKTWDYQSFAPGTEKYQYKNWSSIPQYFKRDAFFEAIPGSWDFSKWLYGDLCCGAIDESSHPVIQPDPCSALAYNIYTGNSGGGLEFNIHLSYSGYPQYFWMRSDWRRLTKQAFDSSFKPQTPGTIGNDSIGEVCDQVDGGMIVDNDSDNTASGLYGWCGQSTQSVWGEARPMGEQMLYNRQRPILPPCENQDPCTGEENTYTKGVLPSDARNISRNFDIPPTVSFKSTKDIFQMRIDRYGSANFTSATAPCAKHIQTYNPYFRYSERHYYFGYDRELDTYDIYLNPDFLHVNTTNALDRGLTGATFISPNPGIGFGGGTGPDGGTQAGLCGYYSLFNYPMTGPNYALEKYQNLPVNFPNNQEILENLQAAFCSILIPKNSCYSCGGNARNIADAIRYFGGYASFAWRSQCDGTGDNTGENINTMWAPYYYIPYIKTYLPPEQLLKGTCSYIGLTMPPSTDPNFIKYSFIDVLGNSAYTETTEPWLHGTSQKWIPLCWESKNYVANICGVSSSSVDAICFAGSNEPTNGLNNELLYLCLGTGPNFYTSPVQCGLVACCPDE